MKKVLKWIGIVLGALLVIIVLVAAGLAVYAQASFKPTYADRPLYPITADTSPEGATRGKYLMEDAMLCAEACHSINETMPFAGGFEAINEGPISVVFAPPNLTSDEATGLGSWTDAEIARAIREGVDKDGVGLIVMPSYTYRALSDEDVAAVVGYLRGVEPVHNEVPPMSGNIVAKIMVALGAFGPSPVGEPISEAQTAPEPGTVDYGAYMVSLGACRDCHGEDLAGGPLPFAAPGDVMAANLTPAGDLSGWTEGQFIAAVTAGIGEGGRTLDEEMPRYRMTEEDLRAIFAYLQTIPAVQSEQ
jgi:mono/diheme cytochrome c family protein